MVVSLIQRWAPLNQHHTFGKMKWSKNISVVGSNKVPIIFLGGLVISLEVSGRTSTQEVPWSPYADAILKIMWKNPLQA